MVGGRARDRLDNYQLTNNIEEDEALTKARLRRINRDVVLLHKVGVVCWGLGAANCGNKLARVQAAPPNG